MSYEYLQNCDRDLLSTEKEFRHPDAFYNFPELSRGFYRWLGLDIHRQDEEAVKQEKPFKEFSAAMFERVLNQITTLLEWILYPAIPEFAKAAAPEDTVPKIQARKFEKKFNGFKAAIVITKKDRHKVKIEVMLSDDTQNHDFF